MATRARRARRRPAFAPGRHPSGTPNRNPRTGRSNFAYPRGIGPTRNRRPAYPIDARHVHAALSRSAQSGTAGSSATVRRAIARKYGSVQAGLAAGRRARNRNR